MGFFEVQAHEVRRKSELDAEAPEDGWRELFVRVQIVDHRKMRGRVCTDKDLDLRCPTRTESKEGSESPTRLSFHEIQKLTKSQRPGMAPQDQSSG